MASEKLAPVIQYFSEAMESARQELVVIGRDMRPSRGPKHDEEYDRIVDLIAEKREKLAESRHFLIQLHYGEYTEAALYFERKIAVLEMSRSVWDGPASLVALGASSVNRQRERSAAEQAKFKKLAECLARCK